jgi:hypothetical protein
MLLHLLAQTELKNRTRTHALLLSVDYKAGKKVPFQVGKSARQVSDMYSPR